MGKTIKKKQNKTNKNNYINEGDVSTIEYDAYIQSITKTDIEAKKTNKRTFVKRLLDSKRTSTGYILPLVAIEFENFRVETRNDLKDSNRTLFAVCFLNSKGQHWGTVWKRTEEEAMAYGAEVISYKKHEKEAQTRTLDQKQTSN